MPSMLATHQEPGHAVDHEIVQLAPTPTLLPQVLVWPKSDALVPVTPMPVIVKAAVPGFESVIVWAVLVVPVFWLTKVSVAGLSEACAIPTPVPLRAAV